MVDQISAVVAESITSLLDCPFWTSPGRDENRIHYVSNGRSSDRPPTRCTNTQIRRDKQGLLYVRNEPLTCTYVHTYNDAAFFRDSTGQMRFVLVVKSNRL
jgi:hypothetical protein